MRTADRVWNDEKIREFGNLLYSLSRVSKKSYGRESRMMGGDLKIHHYIYPSKPLDSAESKSTSTFTLQEFDACYAKYNESDAREKNLAVSNALYEKFHDEVSCDMK